MTPRTEQKHVNVDCGLNWFYNTIVTKRRKRNCLHSWFMNERTKHGSDPVGKTTRLLSPAILVMMIQHFNNNIFLRV